MDITIYKPQYITELGKRGNQEDSIFPCPENVSEQSRCIILCDGMGGLDAGEVASNVVSKALGEYVEDYMSKDSLVTDSLFEEALGFAYDQLDKSAAASDNSEMGTTLAFLCFHTGGCLAAYIGDSRIYHIRPYTNEILYRSRDHSLVYQLFEEGEITLDEMKTSPKKNIILRAILPNPKPRTVADIIHIKDIAPGDYFLVGSDGLFENMEDLALMNVLKSDKSDEEKCQEIKRLSEANDDNHSAYIVHVKDVVKSELDAGYPDDERAARDANKVLGEESRLEEVTVVENDSSDEKEAVPQPNDEVGADVNMDPIQLKHSGEKLSIIIVIVTLVVISAAVAFFFMQRN